MYAVVQPAALHGTVAAIPSKSHVHRLLICAALGDRPLSVPCALVSADIAATASCLTALGAKCEMRPGSIHVTPLTAFASRAELDPGDSGSTYRFLTPLAALCGEVRFALHGKLPSRPMDELWGQMELHGASITGKGTASPSVSGGLTPGEYTIPGNVSSQFISGLLFVLPLLDGDSRIVITSHLESASYVEMTLDSLSQFGIRIKRAPDGFIVRGRQKYRTPDAVEADGDWSNAAFWLCAGAACGGISITGLNVDSRQGDKAVLNALCRFGAEIIVEGSRVTVEPHPMVGTVTDVANTPDLVPALAVAAAAARGRTTFTHAERLRLKESDRIESVCAGINAVCGHASSSGGEIYIDGTGMLSGGRVDACGDHRIAMMGACASVLCSGQVTISGAQAVNKSYPRFFEDFAALGGRVELERGDAV